MATKLRSGPFRPSGSRSDHRHPRRSQPGGARGWTFRGRSTAIKLTNKRRSAVALAASRSRASLPAGPQGPYPVAPPTGLNPPTPLSGEPQFCPQILRKTRSSVRMHRRACPRFRSAQSSLCRRAYRCALGGTGIGRTAGWHSESAARRSSTGTSGAASARSSARHRSGSSPLARYLGPLVERRRPLPDRLGRRVRPGSGSTLDAPHVDDRFAAVGQGRLVSHDSSLSFPLPRASLTMRTKAMRIRGFVPMSTMSTWIDANLLMIRASNVR